MGAGTWCGVGAVIRESTELSEYPVNFTCGTLIIFLWGGGNIDIRGETYPGLPPSPQIKP